MIQRFCITFSLIQFFLSINVYLPAQNYHQFIEYQYKKQTYPELSSELSQNYVLIGMYWQALMEEEKRGVLLGLKLIAKDQKMEAKNAYPSIYDAIRKNRIVILNEAHSIPLNRVTFYTIIDSLKILGINSVFIETLAYRPNDTASEIKESLEDRGTYGGENIFRQILYKLKQSDLNVYSYEVGFNDLDTMTIQGKKYIISKKDTKWVPLKADNYILTQFLSKDDFYQREAEQALKIFQKLQRNDIDKALIYCGYAHAWRQGANMIDILEHLLKEKTFAIDQTILNERVNKNMEDPLYGKFATAGFHPFVIVNEQDQPIHTVGHISKNTSSDKFVDLVIGSPRSTYINNRPTWLELNGDRKRYNLSTFMDESKYTDFLVCFYTPEELQKKKEEYTPDDVFQVFGNVREYDAVLKPNRHYQLIVTKDGKEIINKTVTTK